MNRNYANYLLNKITEDYNKIGDKYSSVREKNWKEMSFLFDKYLEEENKVLDLGCGNGRFYPLFQEKKVDYLGIDSSHRLIKIAKEKYPEVRFETESIFDLDYDDRFDRIFSIAVLHHIPSEELRKEFLKMCFKFLKKDGILVLTVWNLKEKMNKGFNVFSFLKGLTMDKGDVFIPWYGAKEVYFHCFTLEELVQLSSEVGFEIIDKGEILVGLKPYSNFYIVCKKNG
jgi:2-polyprenyl-3-methyl-5-hydroxy-6-metoxy-1,4-benzoquinol methylase